MKSQHLYEEMEKLADAEELNKSPDTNGWRARCRSLLESRKTLLESLKQAERERDELDKNCISRFLHEERIKAVELERDAALECMSGNAVLLNEQILAKREAQQERDQLRAQCSDFREALEKIVYSRRDGVMPTAVRRIAREILSKHAKSNGGEK